MVDLDVAKARSHFPALVSGYIFADNAGGSQAAKPVIDKIVDYLVNN
jgi:selenocysteine lyase/cysteine desulfurase